MSSIEEVITNTLQRTLEFLDRNGIEYVHRTHPITYTAREVATVEQMPPQKMAKTVLFLCEQGYGMVVVPADELVDFANLRAEMGVDVVRLASQEELGKLFPESELGATVWKPVRSDRLL